MPISVEMSEVPTLELGKPFGRVIKSDISTESRLSSNPTSRDPLEERNLEVKGRLYFLTQHLWLVVSPGFRGKGDGLLVYL